MAPTGTQPRTKQPGPLQASLLLAASGFNLSELEATPKSHRCSLGQQLSGSLIRTVSRRCASFPLNPPGSGLAAAGLPTGPSRCRELCPPALARAAAGQRRAPSQHRPLVSSWASHWLPVLPRRSSALMSCSRAQFLWHRGEKRLLSGGTVHIFPAPASVFRETRGRRRADLGLGTPAAAQPCCAARIQQSSRVKRQDRTQIGLGLPADQAGRSTMSRSIPVPRLQGSEGEAPLGG